MTTVTCKFESQMTQVVFEPATGDHLAVLLAQEKASPNAELKVNFLETKEADGQAVVLQSPTGSTKVRIEQSGRALVQTTYFDSFMEADAWQARDDYFLNKTGVLLRSLTSCGSKLLMLGATTKAKVPESSPPTLRPAAERAFSVPRDMVSGAEVFDFALRVSCVLADAVFFNSLVGWYQTRSVSMQVPVQPGPSSTRVPAIWETALDEEGVEMKYDWNNKYGLFAGRRDWTPDDLLGLARLALAESKKVHDSLWSRLVKEVERV